MDPHRASLEQLLACTSATLRISNQKNGRMGQTIHHAANKNETTGPTKALARRVHHILSNGGDGDFLLCAYKTPTGWGMVNSQEIIGMV